MTSSAAGVATENTHPPDRGSVAVLPWGDLIEDFLDEIGVSLDEFSSKMTGGWLFGYAAALQRQGVRTVILCVSGRVTSTLRTVHRPTGAAMIFVPVPAVYKMLRRQMKDPYGPSLYAMFGATAKTSRPFWRVVHHAAPYLATPMLALALEIRRAGCRAILCQEYESPRFDAAVLVASLLHIPAFATFQGGTWHRSGVERRLRRHTLRKSSGVIVASSIEAERIRTQYGVPEAKVAHIFNPLDVSEWRPVSRGAARRCLDISDTARVAIWHGRIDIHRKGLDVLLEAWCRICANDVRTDLLLLLVGSGVDAEPLEREIENRRVPAIQWVRHYVLDKMRIRQYLSAADVYVLPSRHEGFPVSPLEAMACGLPVVAASAPGVSDIFMKGPSSGGIVVPTGDPEALARALGDMLADQRLAREIGANGRRRVEDAFGLDAVGARLCRFLQ